MTFIIDGPGLEDTSVDFYSTKQQAVSSPRSFLVAPAKLHLRARIEINLFQKHLECPVCEKHYYLLCKHAAHYFHFIITTTKQFYHAHFFCCYERLFLPYYVQ